MSETNSEQSQRVLKVGDEVEVAHIQFETMRGFPRLPHRS